MTAVFQAPAAAVRYASVMDDVPDPQVPARAKRRTFTRQYKLQIITEYDAATAAERATLMRREGLYSSHICEWRKQRDTLAKGTQVRRGRPARDPREVELARLKRENERLSVRLEKAELVIDVQKKLCALFGVDPMTGEPS